MADSLTVALAAVGGVVLAGIVAHGAWQARRAGPRQPSNVEPAPPRELREPTFDQAPAAAPADPPVQDEPVLSIKRPPAAPKIDALIDAVTVLSLDAPVAGEAALVHWPASRRAGSKLFSIEGRNADTGEWETPVAGRRYAEFQAGVQMANRTGALNEIEYSEFVQKVQAFADAVGATPDFPDMLDVVARSRELDGFAGQHDAQLAVRLKARSAAWSVGYLQQHATRQGFVPGVVAGRFVLPSAEEGAPPVLTLNFDSQAALADDPNASAVRDITLSFDVPQTDLAIAPFSVWRSSAQALAREMDAQIVDDNGQPLNAEGFDAIDRELKLLYRALEQRDLAAGSAVARRLFS